MDPDVVNYILGIMISMTDSNLTSSYAKVSTWSGKFENNIIPTNVVDGKLSEATHNGVFGLYIDHNNHLLITESHSIRIINMEKETIRTLCGSTVQGNNDGNEEEAVMSLPVFIAQDQKGDYIVLESHGHQIKKLVVDKNEMNDFKYNNNHMNESIVIENNNKNEMKNNFKDNDNEDEIEKTTIQYKKLKSQLSTIYGYRYKPSMDLRYPHWVGYDSENRLMCTDTVNNDICFIHEAEKKNTLGDRFSLVGENFGTLLSDYQKVWSDDIKQDEKVFNYPAVACHNTKGELILCDYHHHRLLKIKIEDKKFHISVFAGSKGGGFKDGQGNEAKFKNPNGVALDVDDYIICCDAGNGAIRRISPFGVVTTIAGGFGTEQPFINYQNLGNNSGGYQDGFGNNARFNIPTNVAVDNNGNLLVADWKNHVIRKIVF
jgi:hypothetical protein